MEPHRDQVDLAAELRALRPRPRPAFTAELDARAEAGFAGGDGHATSPLGRIPRLFGGVPRRRLLAPAAAVALTAIAVATAVVLRSEGGPATSTPPAPGPLSSRSTAPAERNATGGAAAVPKSQSGGAAESAGAAGSPAPTIFPEVPPPPGPYASRARHRDVERSAEIVLATDPSAVRSAAAKVFETVQTYHGIVLRSSIQDGGEGEAGASFDLLIPSGRLAGAMAAFSAIADVRSRHETTQDVTGPMIGLGERLRDARAKVESLLAQLAAAETEAQREVAEAKLRSARRHAAALRAQLTALRRRTHLSGVSLRIETGGGGISPGGGGWGVSDALGDAGHILSVAAGVVLVGLAVLAAPALILLLAGLAHREWVRRRREHALDAQKA